jgi:hypothetical protein
MHEITKHNTIVLEIYAWYTLMYDEVGKATGHWASARVQPCEYCVCWYILCMCVCCVMFLWVCGKYCVYMYVMWFLHSLYIIFLRQLFLISHC